MTCWSSSSTRSHGVSMDYIKIPKGSVLIRGLRAKDSSDIANLMSCDGVTYGLSSMPYTNEFAVKSLMEDYTNKHWLIAEYEGGVVGFLYLNWGSGRWRRIATLAMGVHDDFAGLGIGGSLVERSLRIGFLYLDMERIELVVYQDNKGAIKIYERNGFIIEGQRSQQVIREGCYYDSYLMGIVRQDYTPKVD